MRLVVTVICLLGTLFNLNAQQTLYRHFTVEEGLPSLTIHQINQDQLGYIWLATDKGVSQYDGYQFANYTVKDGLPSNNIREIYIDQSNRIWLIGDGNAIAFIQNNKIVTVSSPDEAIEIKEKGIHEWEDEIWIDTEQGLFIYKNETLKPYKTPNKSWDFLGIDKAGLKWFYDEDARLYPNGDIQKAIQIPLDSSEILDSRIFQWSDDRVYFETEEQLYFYKDTLTPIQLFSGLSISEQHAPHLISRRDVRFFNKKGHEVIGLKYAKFGGFSDDMCRVKIDSLWGFVDKNGEEVIPCQYKEARNFSEGVAAVFVDENWIFIDKKGETVLNPTAKISFLEEVGTFKNGLCWYKVGKFYGYFDKKGKVKIKAQFTKAFDFEGDVARVVSNRKTGVIDQKGNWVLKPELFEVIFPFDENGVAVVRKKFHLKN